MSTRTAFGYIIFQTIDRGWESDFTKVSSIIVDISRLIVK